MKFCLVLLLVACCIEWSAGMLYRRDQTNMLKPDLMAISSTVVPLPVYSVFSFENKLLRDSHRKRPLGKVELVTKHHE